MSQSRKLLRWLWNICVVGVMAYCLWGLIRDTRELTPLKLEVKRLEKLVGYVEVRDESLVHVLSIKSDSPDELVWRVILPAGHTWNLSHQIASAGGGTATWVNDGSQDKLIQARLIKLDGNWNWLVMHDSGSATNGVAESFGDFAKRHWKDFDIEIAGQSNQIAHPVTDVVSLLKVIVPQTILTTAKEELGDYVYKRLQNEPLLQIEIGTPAAFAARKQNTAAQ